MIQIYAKLLQAIFKLSYLRAEILYLYLIKYISYISKERTQTTVTVIWACFHRRRPLFCVVNYKNSSQY